MADNKKIKTALISVFHKDGLEELLKKLNDEGVKFLSTVYRVTGLRVREGGERDDIPINPGWSCEDLTPESIRWYPGTSRVGG